MRFSIGFLLAILTASAQAQTKISFEGDLTWQSRNDQRVPGNTGTDFSISDFDAGPFPGYRVYAGHTFDGRHEIRALYAPLAIKTTGRFDGPVVFQESTFAAGQETEAYYKFNSYRLTYAYHFDPVGSWKFALGFTGKIRDAEVRLTQGALRESKSNVGFVPLLNLQAVREIAGDWSFRFDMDGLAAPQGRAFDIALFIERDIGESWDAFTGYRTIEGGADNDKVYNMAWLHKFVVGVNAEF
jgi:hypothetical protein